MRVGPWDIGTNGTSHEYSDPKNWPLALAAGSDLIFDIGKLKLEL